MDEGLVIDHDGRVVGVAVRVRGGFMFFSSEHDFRELEARVFRRVEIITQQVAEIVRSKRISGERPTTASQGSSTSVMDVSGGNVVRLHPRPCLTKIEPEPPDAA